MKKEFKKYSKMKIFPKSFIIILLLSSILLPTFLTITKAQDGEEIIFRWGASSSIGDWDPAISAGANILSLHYFPQCCEYPYGLNAQYDGGLGDKKREEQWIPILCTSWETEWRDEEPNLSGFNNTGGIKSITFTLRENVTFHDGSDWNATVFKWNIDRLYLITGNLTGEGDTTNQATYWYVVEAWKDLQSASFNITEYDAPSLTVGVPPDPLDYAGYIIGNDTKYPGIIPDENGVVNNPVPYRGLTPYGAPIHNAPYDKYPIIREVQIVESKKSGGKVKVIFNHWNTYGGMGGVNTPSKISYASYYKNYTGRGIYGYENGFKHPRNPTIVDHMIGTGPYKYVLHNETASPAGGYLIKNEDYWNRTALEADGWFDVDKVEFINFPTTQIGKDMQNIALLTHVIDACADTASLPIDYDAVIANPNIRYIEDHPSEYKTQITLNSINETYWADPNAFFAPGITYDTLRKFTYVDKENCGGVPRALRKAISYAFDYDLMIDTVLDVRAVRGGGVVSSASLFYNESVPIAEYNLEYAREILLTTECNATGGDGYTKTPNANIYNFSKLCADRSLTSSSTDADWQYVAETNPIFILDFYWDDKYEDLKNILGNSLAKIGVAYSEGVKTYDNKVPTTIWDIVSTYWISTFDGSHSIWSANAWVMDYYMPEMTSEEYIEVYYNIPYSKTFPRYNYAFCYDEEINEWIKRMCVSDPKNKNKWISKIAYKEQNELFPMVFSYQTKAGICLWKDWDTFWVKGRVLNKTFYWGSISFHFLSPSEPPESFVLNSDAESPDDDGEFTLTWDTALGAENYSVYEYSSNIAVINDSLTSLAIETTDLLLPLTGYIDGTYYFIVVAHNDYGDTLSNCHKVIVEIRKPPDSFVLDSDAESPDDDGEFTLTWDAALGAENYSVYEYSSNITVINDSLTSLAIETTDLSLPLTGYTDGTYYFIVVAHNDYGDTLSNCIKIEVKITSEGDENGEGAIAVYHPYLMIIILTAIIALIIRKQRKKLNF